MRARLTTLGAISAIAGWLAVVGLPPTLVLTPDEEAQYEVLVQAAMLNGPAVGYGAVEPPEARALRYFAQHPHGATVFKHVLLRGEPAGKLYGLIGLRHTSPRFFQVAVQPFRVWPGSVATMFGCIASGERIRNVVASDQPGAVRLRRGETLAQWLRRHPKSSMESIDILGGGYTSMFLDWKELTRPDAL